MWNAIKSDLFDFVATIQEDTTKTINKVLGEDDVEEDTEKVLREKIIADIRRSFETYDLPVKEASQREFDRYFKKFDLGSHANSIAETLDAEPEVSRFYAELVPLKMTPELFWSRLFFRIKVANRDRSGVLADEEEDEEELLWESEDAKEEASNKNIEEKTNSTFGKADTSTSNSSSDVMSQLRKQNKELQGENAKLQGQVRSLVSRIAQLEEINAKLLGAQGSVPDLITTSTTEKSNNESNNQNNNNSSSINNKVNSAGEVSETLSTSSDGSAVMINSNSFNINTKGDSGGSNSSDSKQNPPYIAASPITSPAATDSDAQIAIGRTPVQSSIPLVGLDEEEDDEWN